MNYCTQVCIVMLAIMLRTEAADYYIHNDSGLALNLLIECGSNQEVIAVATNAVAYFKTNTCSDAPNISIKAAGKLPKNALQAVQNVPLTPYVRLSLDSDQKLLLLPIDLAKDTIPDGDIQNYDLSL